MKTIVFKEPFESKLKELKVKGKFVKNMLIYEKVRKYNARNVKTHRDMMEASEDFATFVARGFLWSASPEECLYWGDIARNGN